MINTDTDRPLGATATSVAKVWATSFWYALLAATLAAAALFGRRLCAIPRCAACCLHGGHDPAVRVRVLRHFRYRIPLEPLMIVVAAGGAQLAARRLRHT